MPNNNYKNDIRRESYFPYKTQDYGGKMDTPIEEALEGLLTMTNMNIPKAWWIVRTPRHRQNLGLLADHNEMATPTRVFIVITKGTKNRIAPFY